MKFICTLSFLFFAFTTAATEPSKPPPLTHLNFNTYVAENYKILSRVKKPEKSRMAFGPDQPRNPESVSDPTLKNNNVSAQGGYGLDKSGNVSAGSGSLWGAMGGNPQPAAGTPQQQQQQQQTPAAAPPQPSPSPPSSSSSSGSGDAPGMPQ